MDLRLVVLGLVDLEISGFAISGFVAAPHSVFRKRNATIDQNSTNRK